MDLMLVLWVVGLLVPLVVAVLAWRYPRAVSAADPSLPAEQKDDEGLALALLIGFALWRRARSRQEAASDSN